jgi:RNA polymerase sigma-70 factor (ECF subfamily)
LKTRQGQFVKVIEEHAGILHKVCRIYQSSIGYDDLYQEIVIQLWKSFDSFKGNSKISTWIYRVALNTAITFFKKKKIEFSEIDNTHYEAEETDEYDTGKSKQMYQAIALLNDIEKALIFLYLEGKNYEEISNTLGITEGNTRVKMNRIKNKLKNIINNGTR